MDLFSYMLGKKQGGGSGGSGGGFPELIYETTFEVEANVSSGSGTLCTISTGLTDNSLYENRETLMAIIERNSDDGVGPNSVLSVQQSIYAAFSGFNPSQSAAIYTTYHDSAERFTSTYSNAQNAYVSAITADMSTITLSYRAALTIYAGTYTLKLYRTGFANVRNY